MIPAEWLREVTQTRDGLRCLLEETGSLSMAAYRIARAKCLSAEHSTHVPSRIDVKAAARLIASKVPGITVPSSSILANECEAFGLNVI